MDPTTDGKGLCCLGRRLTIHVVLEGMLSPTLCKAASISKFAEGLRHVASTSVSDPVELLVLAGHRLHLGTEIIPEVDIGLVWLAHSMRQRLTDDQRKKLRQRLPQPLWQHLP